VLPGSSAAARRCSSQHRRLPGGAQLALAIGLLALPAVARATPSVVVFPSAGRPTTVSIAGRVLRASPEKRQGSLSRNLGRLVAKSAEGVPVDVFFAGQVRHVRTGREGEFAASFTAHRDLPFALGLQPVRVQATGTEARGQVDVVSDEAPFMVVSDFDDTVAITNVQSTRDTLHTAFLEDSDSHPVVDGMAAFFRCLRDVADPPPGFAFVTGSPVEFGPRVESFLVHNGFPFAGLHLRQLGRKTISGYKEPVLRSLLSRFPQPFVLVGDSGEKDPEVYARIREEFPGRVAAIFIHDVGRAADPARFKGMVVFRTGTDAARQAAALGLLRASCLEPDEATPGGR